MANYLAEVVGWSTIALFLAKIVYNLGHFAYTTFLGRLLGHGVDVKQCGPWAGIHNFHNTSVSRFNRSSPELLISVVTGATDGIGKSYAKAVRSISCQIYDCVSISSPVALARQGGAERRAGEQESGEAGQSGRRDS